MNKMRVLLWGRKVWGIDIYQCLLDQMSISERARFSRFQGVYKSNSKDGP